MVVMVDPLQHSASNRTGIDGAGDAFLPAGGELLHKFASGLADCFGNGHAEQRELHKARLIASGQVHGRQQRESHCRNVEQRAQ
ncbi:hypothetical protein D3C85_1643020 [compost metagenome]